ncbi:MAG: hypothetical protein AAGF58_11865 [Pseudomonadota bacterium]
MSRLKDRMIRAEDSALPAMRLGALLDQKIDVFCWCNRCGHNQVMPTPTLVNLLGPDIAVPEIGARMRCSRCKSRDVATRPNWPDNS